MNPISSLLTATLLLVSSMAWAQSPSTLKKEVEDSCRDNQQQLNWINCACLAEKVEAQHALTPDRYWPNIVPEVAAQCPADKKHIADFVFTACDSYQQSIRTDHEAFCHCAADKPADDYIAKPVFNLRYMENLRRVALQGCGISDNSRRIVAEPPPPAPEPVNLASANCVKWQRNQHFDPKAEHPGGDVILVNGCPSSIWVMETIADAFHIDGGPLDKCHADELIPKAHKILRSQTQSGIPAFDKTLPKVAAFVCAGPAAAILDRGTGSRACACAPGVANVPMPAKSALN